MNALPYYGATLAEVLRNRAASGPNDPAFVFLDHKGDVSDHRTFATLDANARSVASELTARDLRGQRVMLVFPPGLDFVAALFGCFYAGCIAVPAPYLTGNRAGARSRAIFQDCAPAAILTATRLQDDAGIQSALHFGPTQVQWIHIDEIDQAEHRWGPPAVSPDEIALLQYTSGSTNTPKGVILSHANLIANNAMVREAFGHGRELRGVGWLPLFHDMGLIGHVLQPVFVGGISVLMSPLSFLKRPVLWLKAISEWRATTSGGPSYAFDLCARVVRPEQSEVLDLSSWTVAYCGSEFVRPDVLERFIRRFGQNGFRSHALSPCYGLAEATLMVTAGAPGTGMRTIRRPSAKGSGRDIGARAVVSCGRTWGGAEIAIADPEFGTPLEDGQIGEIWVHGPNVARGYWADAEQSRRTFGARIEDDPRHYLRTGDLGFLRNGELFVTGRLKDTIIIRGSKHAPEDIEATIAASHPAYAALPGAAFGFQVPQGEQIVVVQELARMKGPNQQHAAAEAALEHVARYHGLRLFDLVLLAPGGIPRTSSGKVQRHRCRELYQQNGFHRLNPPGDLPWLGVNEARRKLPEN